MIEFDRVVGDVETGEDLGTVITTILARGDGGCGGGRKLARKTNLISKTEPDFVCDISTQSQQALLYRLLGDYNPLHASPNKARSVGFDGPILHGLCTIGMATHALLKTCCNYDTTKFKHTA
ncbi:MAG: acyl dehydratase [Pseudohongiellaceae bacterium]